METYRCRRLNFVANLSTSELGIDTSGVVAILNLALQVIS